MAYKILTKNGIDNSNIDGARGEYFNSGMRDGIVQGALNEGLFTATASNIISLDTCELRIAGHRIVIDEPVYHTFTNAPSSDTRYAFVAQIIVDDNQNVDFSLFVQTASTPLIQNDLYKKITGAGTYQIEIGRFTLLTTLEVVDVIKTIETITGANGIDGDYIRIGKVTTTMLDAGLDAEVDVENVVNQTTGLKETNFNFNIPKTAGSVVNVGGQQVGSVNFTSDPQTQLNNKIDKDDLDTELSETSENAVQNKVITNAINNKSTININDIAQSEINFDSDPQEQIDSLNESKISVGQGTTNAGKALIVGEDGNVSPQSIPTGLPVGSIISSAIPLNDVSVHLLDGTTILQNGIYADFATYLKAQISAGYDLSCTQTEFDNDVTNTGNCGKFVIDDTAGTIRLPKITRFIQGLTNINNIGQSLSAGLPNIQGNLNSVVMAQTWDNPPLTITGPFSVGTTVVSPSGAGSGYLTYLKPLTFDASQANDIYGNSTTVQVEATQYPYYIVLANSVSGDISANINNILNELNPVVIYDKNSTDANVNLGYTDGLLIGGNISVDLSQYSRVRVYASLNNFDVQSEICLNNREGTDFTGFTCSTNYSTFYIVKFFINSSRTRFTTNFVSQTVIESDGTVAKSLINNNSDYYVYRIEAYHI